MPKLRLLLRRRPRRDDHERERRHGMNRKDRIRQIVLYTVYILFFSTLQVTFPGVFSFRGQTADFMMVFVIITGYLFGSTDGAVIGLIVGFLRDMLASSTLGTGMMLLLYVGILSSILFSRQYHSRVALGFIQVLLITLAYKIIGHILFFAVPLVLEHDRSYLSLGTIVLDSILPQALVNLLAAVPIILLLRFAGPYRKGYVRASEDRRNPREDAWQIR